MRFTFLFVAGWAAALQLNPVTRVAELMEGLAKKVAADGKAEQELYDKFKCWCTKVLDSKATSMAANEARISELESYIDDLTSGRVELTGERVKLEEEIKGLEKTIAEETDMREKEHEDFLAAKDEMEKALAALNQSIDVLGEATKDHQEGVLSSVSKKLEKVMTVGQGFLAKNDLAELHKILDVPEVDWKKLNREATFKKKYKARSGGIQEILADMRDTFANNLNEAIATEDKAAADFDALMTAKKEQLGSAKQALLDKTGEKGARAEALATSEEELKDLQAQNERDTGYVADTEATCKERAEQWSERKRLRAEEIASIQEAIGILRSDDARDTFKKSFDSQGLFFTQIEAVRHMNNARSKALGKITELAAKDARVAMLVAKLTNFELKEDPPAEVDEADPFVEIIKMIDDIILDLEKEEADDLATKDRCEKERMDTTQEAKMVAKEIDTNVETMDRLTSEIDSMNKTVQDIIVEISELELELKDARMNREDEHKEYGAAKFEDETAVGLIGDAMAALQKFYDDNGLLQLKVARRSGQEPFVAAGEAPTPPPSTWEGDYGGAKGESTGVLAMLEMIKEDIQKDMAKADKQESEAEENFLKLEEDINSGIEKKRLTMGDLEGGMASREEERANENATMVTNHEELASKMSYLKEIAPGCDFMAMNFDIRLKNRQTESDGLKKAKAILEGATFD
jgi:predicted  nucleic acid-binding Zn-ribbon protein